VCGGGGVVKIENGRTVFNKYIYLFFKVGIKSVEQDQVDARVRLKI
jgi:hypothetical protein